MAMVTMQSYLEVTREQIELRVLDCNEVAATLNALASSLKLLRDGVQVKAQKLSLWASKADDMRIEAIDWQIGSLISGLESKSDMASGLAQSLIESGEEMKQSAERMTTSDDYFGSCPVCHKSDGYLNIHRDHYGVCHEHHKFWPIGSNLFSSWMEEDTGVWIENSNKMENYEECKPWFPPQAAVESTQAAEADLVF
jgi:hypothetical protein